MGRLRLTTQTKESDKKIYFRDSDCDASIKWTTLINRAINECPIFGFSLLLSLSKFSTDACQLLSVSCHTFSTYSPFIRKGTWRQLKVMITVNLRAFGECFRHKFRNEIFLQLNTVPSVNFGVQLIRSLIYNACLASSQFQIRKYMRIVLTTEMLSIFIFIKVDQNFRDKISGFKCASLS